MKLILHRDDLKPEHENIACGATLYSHFNQKAQKAIIAVGFAKFEEYSGMNYNRVYAPKGKGEDESQ